MNGRVDKRVIISVHVPKAAGTTMLHLFQQAFGKDAVMADYGDIPGNPASACEMDPEGFMVRRPMALAPEVRVVHGHFKARKYDLIPGAFRMTVLRHPVDNLLSIYRYWQHIPLQPSPLHQYFRRENLSALQLARIPLIRYLYSRTFFGEWDIGRLDFVAFHDTRQRDLARLSGMLGVCLDTELHMNPTSSFIKRKKKAAEAGEVSDAEVKKIEEALEDDLRLYDRLREKFAKE